MDTIYYVSVLIARFSSLSGDWKIDVFVGLDATLTPMTSEMRNPFEEKQQESIKPWHTISPNNVLVVELTQRTDIPIQSPSRIYVCSETDAHGLQHANIYSFAYFEEHWPTMSICREFPERSDIRRVSFYQ